MALHLTVEEVNEIPPPAVEPPQVIDALEVSVATFVKMIDVN